MKQKRSYSLARAAMTLFLVMLTSIASWATGGTLAGSGTSSDPYVIVDADFYASECRRSGDCWQCELSHR